MSILQTNQIDCYTYNNGRIIYTEPIELDTGITVFQLPVKDNWPDGTYVVRIIYDGLVVSNKLIVSR